MYTLSNKYTTKQTLLNDTKLLLCITKMSRDFLNWEACQAYRIAFTIGVGVRVQFQGKTYPDLEGIETPIIIYMKTCR